MQFVLLTLISVDHDNAVDDCTILSEVALKLWLRSCHRNAAYENLPVPRKDSIRLGEFFVMIVSRLQTFSLELTLDYGRKGRPPPFYRQLSLKEICPTHADKRCLCVDSLLCKFLNSFITNIIKLNCTDIVVSWGFGGFGLGRHHWFQSVCHKRR